jgi:soluble lytic murein transglycosylase-like protein
MDYADGLPAELLDALFMQESNQDPQAYNKATGATGLGQIMPPALEDFNLLNKERYTMKDMFDPQLNARVSNWYLYDRIPAMLMTYKMPVTIDNVLASYNFGIGNVRKGKALPKETRDYIRNIKVNLEKLQKEKVKGI